MATFVGVGLQNILGWVVNMFLRMELKNIFGTDCGDWAGKCF